MRKDEFALLVLAGAALAGVTYLLVDAARFEPSLLAHRICSRITETSAEHHKCVTPKIKELYQQSIQDR